MLTRRTVQALRSVTSSSSSPTFIFSRAFTSTLTQQEKHRAPALADIKPDAGSEFDARQKQFREQLAANQRKKELEESQSRRLSAARGSSSSTSFSNDPPSSDANAVDNTLDSLTFAHAEEARARESAAQDGKKGGPLSSLFYGTEAGRNMDKEMERSFSQVLARGKYVHTIVFHEVKPEKVDEYVDLVGMWYPKISTLPENKVNLVGSWRTEVGDCDTFGLSNPLTSHPMTLKMFIC
jgi:hypothetical protein